MTIDVGALRALESAATLGPWSNSDSTVDNDGCFHENVTASAWDVACCHPGDQHPDDDRDGQARRNAEFIAAARNALPELLDLVESQAGEIERARNSQRLSAQQLLEARIELARHRALVADLHKLQPMHYAGQVVADALYRHGFTPDGES